MDADTFLLSSYNLLLNHSERLSVFHNHFRDVHGPLGITEVKYQKYLR